MRLSRDSSTRLFIGAAITALTSFLYAASPAPVPATTTMPATAVATLSTNVLRSGNHQATFEIRQDDQAPQQDSTNTFHLRPAPFSIHLTGDVDDVAIANAHTDTLIKALSAAKRPVVFITATNAVYDPGNLFINDKSTLTPWETFKIVFGDEAGESTKVLNEKLGQLPVVLDSSIQFLAAYLPNGRHDCSFQITTLYQIDRLLFNYSNREELDQSRTPIQKLDWAKESEVFMVLLITSPIDNNEFFRKIDWKGIHVIFDKK
jgi:hypothetical protein